MQTMTRPVRLVVDTPASTTSDSLPRRANVQLGPLPGSPVSLPRLDVLERPGHVAKRVLDVTISLLALVLLAPLMLMLAIAVKLSSPGPVLFRHERVGREGKLFSVVKFRSMTVGASTDIMLDAVAHRRYQENNFKMDADDPRITRVGRFIRATSIDELPQLFNVLRGDMSLVGIRPLLDEEVKLRARYDQACYLAMRPGMTGLWQVSGRSSIVHEHRHTLDRNYVESWSIWSDLRLLLLTPVAVLRFGDTR